MAAIPAQTLFDEAKCTACYVPATLYEMLKLSLMVRVLQSLDPMAATDAQSLIDYAKCFNCYGQLSAAQMMELALLDQISQLVAGLGPAAGGTATQGIPDPEGVVTAPEGSLYWAIGSQSFWEKQTGAGNTGWIQLI
jgi:hypothetical protein